MKKIWCKKRWLIGALIAAFFGAFCILFLSNVICFNHPSEQSYPVKGVDVSAYQGDIDWEILSKQNIKFAFIKATEGSSFQDKKFQYNFEKAQETNLRVGAYHFFSYDSNGATQAQNFINTVPKTNGALPPVVDIEFYGDKKKNLPPKQETAIILEELLGELERHYQAKPIIYATKKSYELYIKDKYDGYPIWIREVYLFPKLSDHREWTFWQYCDREKLDGYDGKEKFIDVNVFNGTLDEFMHTFN